MSAKKYFVGKKVLAIIAACDHHAVSITKNSIACQG
jgi:hypothetical protein